LAGKPSKKYPIIHVAGTNGKGTFTQKTAKALIKANYSVGQYTSPHISTLRERIQVDNNLIDPDFITEFFDFFEKVNTLKKQGEISYFDFLTVMCFKYWEEKQIDVGVLEVGLGGRLDSTNIVEGEDKILNVVTSIGLDHIEILGNNVEEIAREKLGIVKGNSPTLIGNTVPKKIAEEICENFGSELWSCEEFLGDYSLENKELVKLGAKILEDKFEYGQFVDEVFEEAMICRYEKVPIDQIEEVGSLVQNVILDIGHNIQCFERTIEKVKKDYNFENTKIGVIYSSKVDKDFQRICSVLGDFADKVYFVSTNGSQK
jgi:dihydrofolate synthase/folylpolyglutamate synthase